MFVLYWTKPILTKNAALKTEDYLFPSRLRLSPHLSTRQYARIVEARVTQIGSDAGAYGTHTMRRTKAAPNDSSHQVRSSGTTKSL